MPRVLAWSPGDLDHAGVDFVEEHVVHGRCNAADGAHVAGAAGVGDGLLAVLRLNALPLVGDVLDGLFPADALPFAAAAFAHALHGVLHAIGAVNVVRMAEAAQANAVDAAIGERIERALGSFHDFVVAHVQVQLASARAVAAAHAAEDGFLVGLAGGVILGNGQTAESDGTGGRGHRGCARRLQKAAARESRFRGCLIRHLSSSWSRRRKAPFHRAFGCAGPLSRSALPTLPLRPIPLRRAARAAHRLSHGQWALLQNDRTGRIRLSYLVIEPPPRQAFLYDKL